MLTSVATWLLVALVSTLVVWWGSGLLESSSERLSVYYELPEIVQGAVIVAVGSSFPELATTVISAAVHGEFELGVAVIIGSALFNILVIPALASLAGGAPLQANRDLVYKEAQFYIIAIAVLTLTLAFAVIYRPVGDGAGGIQGELTRWLVVLPVAVYVLYIFVQYQDSMDYDPEVTASEVRPLRQWGILAGSLLIIVAGVEGLVRSAIELGRILDTSSFLWGITVVAAATSVPDAFVSVKAARAGRAITSIANVLGSNVFDLLVCIPAGVLVAGTVVVNFSVVAPLMGVLTLATVILFLMMRTRLVLSHGEARVLLLLYAAFIVWIGVEAFGAVDLVPGLPPASALPA